MKNDAGTFILFETGSIQRHEAKQPDPSIVQFDRYAFDLSQFAGDSQVIHYSVRERYLWELFRPDPNDPHYKLAPGQFRVRTARPHPGADLSVRIPRAGLRVPRRAEHDAAKPHLVDRHAHGRRGVACG